MDSGTISVVSREPGEVLNPRFDVPLLVLRSVCVCVCVWVVLIVVSIVMLGMEII